MFLCKLIFIFTFHQFIFPIIYIASNTCSQCHTLNGSSQLLSIHIIYFAFLKDIFNEISFWHARWNIFCWFEETTMTRMRSQQESNSVVGNNNPVLGNKVAAHSDYSTVGRAAGGNWREKVDLPRHLTEDQLRMRFQIPIWCQQWEDSLTTAERHVWLHYKPHVRYDQTNDYQCCEWYLYRG